MLRLEDKLGEQDLIFAFVDLRSVRKCIFTTDSGKNREHTKNLHIFVDNPGDV